MPKPKREGTVRQMNVYIPSDLLDKVRILLMDPVTGRVAHGALSHLITRLLRDWFQEQQKEQSNG